MADMDDNYIGDDGVAMLEPDHPAMERVQFALQKLSLIHI